MTAPTERIAIVGVGLRLPGAGPDADAYWANVAAATDLARDVPPGRWLLPPDRCLDPRVANPDTAYSARGYYLDPFIPDVAGLSIDPALVAELDPLFHTVLDAGNRAWKIAKTDAVDRARVGVVLGNICLPTDRANALSREYLGGKLADRLGVPREAKATHPLNRYVAGLPAGILAQALGLGGGSYTLDAACATSLYALKLASDELLAGRADAMLAGGANGADCQYTQMGFSQLRALSASGRCSPFDERADGLMVGEGAVVFVLKRLTDALQHGDTVHAVIAGVGLSNDMHGNLLAPAKEGQLRAMRRAYDRAGWKPTDVDLIECHATGTPVGDAVEFDSLRELWGESGWDVGGCVIGSVKSSVGHLLTGAGAAAAVKVMRAMATATLPPQANFDAPAAGLRYTDGPFRVLNATLPWERRTPRTPRRAAVSGFGFGGVNAHLLLEEWTGEVPRQAPRVAVTTKTPPKLVTAKQRAGAAPSPPRETVPVAVVGLAAHFGPWRDLRAFQERVLGGSAAEPAPKRNGWGLADEPCPPGFYVEEIDFPTDRFRIPPKELEETLPQQLLMLQAAAAALDDCAHQPADPAAGDPDTAVFVGLGLDPNTTNYHLRWTALPAPAVADCASPALTANRVMGALGSIAASRVARAFHFGGPSHTVCSEEASAGRAVQLAVRALRAGEIDRAVAGGVDLAGDPRAVLPGGVTLPGEGAAALVLKRLADAERDGDRVYAVITGFGAAGGDAEAVARAGVEANAGGAVSFDAAADIGHAGAASAAASLVKACLALYTETLPAAGTPRYWLHDRAAGPRRATVAAAGADGSHLAFVLEEYPKNATMDATPADRRQPLGARGEAVFVAEGGSPAEVVDGLARLAEFAAARRDRNVEAVARAWWREAPPDGKRPLAVALVARSPAEVAEQVGFATESIRANPTQPLPPDPRPAVRDRVFFAPKPLGPKAKVALVFPGSGNQFDGMGRDLTAQWPAVLRRQQAESDLLRGQFAPDVFWDGPAAEASARDLMFGQVSVGALVADVVAGLGVRCDAVVGLSLGESAGLFGVRAWRGRDEMYRRMRKSTLFVSDLAPPYDAARAHFGTPAGEPVEWASGVIAAAADDVVAALRPGLRAYLLIVNTPAECVIGGERGDVAKLATAVGKPFFPLAGVTLAHCDAGRPVEVPYRDLHTLPVTPPKGVTLYSGAWGRSYAVTEKAAADSITAGLLNPIDVPAVVGAAYRDGVRVFLEVGPGASCTRMIGAILGNKPHLARAAHAAKTDAVSQVLRLVANLAAERVAVDLGALYGRDTLCVGHREPAGRAGPVVVIPVGNRPPELPPLPTRPDPTPVPADVPEPAPTPVAAVIPEYPPAFVPEDSPAAVDAPEPEPEPAYPAAGDDEVSDDEYAGTPWADPAESDAPALVAVIEAACDVRVAAMRAQETFLRVNQRLMESAAGVLRFQTALLGRWEGVRGQESGNRVRCDRHGFTDFRLPTSDSRLLRPDS